MKFFNRQPSEILVHGFDGTTITGADVAAKAAYYSATGAKFAVVLTDSTPASALNLLALLEAGIPLLPLDANTKPESVAALVDRYQPDLLLAPPDLNTDLPDLPPSELLQAGCWQLDTIPPAIHPDLCLLLPTSGSTGSPKLVRLSRQNLLSNAKAIAPSVGITAESRGVTSLPLFYSFGLSVLTSHLIAGSSVLVTSRSLLDKLFWHDLESFRVTHLPGVPQTFLMLRRLGFEDRELHHLKALQQAGGRLDQQQIQYFAELCARTGRDFYVMYGQTEASPRMSCLPSPQVIEKLGSVGIPLAGGHFSIESPDGAACDAGTVGEVTYRGPNVMMGYATESTELAQGDVCHGLLHTGDLGYLDEDGFLFLTGRSKRIAKLAGVRVSLDEVEQLISSSNQVAAIAAAGDGIVLFTTSNDADEIAQQRRDLATRLGTAPKLLQFRQVADIPVLPNGKIDYAELNRWADSDE